MSVITQWMIHGAQIGVTAFFSLFAFAVCFLALLAVGSIVGHLIGIGSGDE